MTDGERASRRNRIVAALGAAALLALLLPLVRVKLPGSPPERVTGPALVGKLREYRSEVRERSGLRVVVDRTKARVSTSIGRKLPLSVRAAWLLGVALGGATLAGAATLGLALAKRRVAPWIPALGVVLVVAAVAHVAWIDVTVPRMFEGEDAPRWKLFERAVGRAGRRLARDFDIRADVGLGAMAACLTGAAVAAARPRR